jgi:hypothetical protein
MIPEQTVRVRRTETELTIAMVPTVIQTAVNGGTITHEDVGREIGMPAIKIAQLLDRLWRDALVPEGLPELWCIVVYKSMGKPRAEKLRARSGSVVSPTARRSIPTCCAGLCRPRCTLIRGN